MSVPVKRELAQGRLTHEIIGSFYEVYNTLGPGFVEPVYSAALERELYLRGLAVEREYSIAVAYKGVDIAIQRLDLVVSGTVAVECKATPLLLPAAQRQLLNYLKATKLEVGLLLHFGPSPRFVRFYAPNKDSADVGFDGSAGSAASENND